MNLEEERMHVNGIKDRCNPRKMGDQTMIVLRAMVEQATQVHDQSAVRELTDRFIGETYEGLAARPMDDRIFESDRHFMRALTMETMARAQEYSIDVQIDRNLSGPDRDSDRAR